ncbi:serine/threonine-protein kinase [Streptomyces sp. NPDC059352]|uniref:serine/threonine-protein kinase n=1 Tax=Streptomyces sp. NPDC059352 TaxID=3346810 RepID=UPI003683FB92
MTVIAGRYRLLDVLAEGATGTVWRALDETRVQEVALKEFRAPAGLPADEVPLLYARLEREARAAARISHPSVATVHGVATEDGRPWVVMELVRGLTLAETLEAGDPLPPPEAARVGAEVLAALRAAREADVRHRGVEPGHVLLANDGRVVVTGFGTGTDAAPEEDPGAESRSLGALLHAAVAGRSGPLDSVIEGLRSEDPGSRPTVDQVERELRRMAGGRTNRARGAGSTRTPPPAPKEGNSRDHGDDGVVGVAGDDGDDGNGARDAGSSVAPAYGAGAPRRRGPRRGPVLAAGLAGALLIAGALTYHFVRDEEPGTGPGPGGVTSTAPAGPGATGTGDGPSATPRR